MQASADRFDFTPPPPPGRAAAIGLAVLAHLLLAVALTLGIRWNKDETLVTAQAEIWAATVQEAAPAPVEAPPPPPPPPAPAPVAVPKPQVAPPAPQISKADIALEREKKRKEEEKKQEELQKKAAEKKAAEKQQADKRKKDEENKRKELAQKKQDEERRKREEADKRARAEAADAQRLEAQRQENLRRIQGLAGATGAPNATGTAQRAAGPSDSYAGRIRAKVKPNIVFSDDVAGNPVAEVEVRMAPDGTITSRKITKSSGVKAWDEAVLRALDRTEVLPRDTDGRVHSPLLMEFRPKG